MLLKSGIKYGIIIRYSTNVGSDDMSKIDKLKDKFYRKPVPKDITFLEMETLFSHYGCQIMSGGKHSKKVVHVESGTVIPIPYHGDTIQECYIVELKRLLDDILEGE